MISGMIGTMSMLIERPVSMRPKHIISIEYGSIRISEGPKKRSAKEVVNKAPSVR
jgi:hypothetical protein